MRITAIPILLISLLISSSLWAGTYWVSPTGEATWANAESETALSGTACTTPALAFANAEAGDIVYFRGGTYTVPAKDTGDGYSGYYNFANAGASDSRITFIAYPGETPVFNGTAEGLGETGGYYATILGIAKSYITIDGLTFQSDNGTKMARVIVGYNGNNIPGPYDVDYVTVQNCTFNGGSTVIDTTGNHEALRIESTEHTTISRCTLYNYNEDGDWHNTSVFKMYHNDYLTIENCEIYDSSVGIYLKSGTRYTTLQYNYIHDCARGMEITTDSYRHDDVVMRHNIVADCSIANIHAWADADLEDEGINNWTITNNTIYNASAPLYGAVEFIDSVSSRSSSYIFRNNVISTLPGTNDSRSGLRWANVTAEADGFDYNAYGANPDVTQGSTHYTTLSTIQGATIAGLTTGNHNTHSFEGAVGFTTATGDRDTIAEFEIVSGDANNGGSDGSDMGADISLVGPDGSESEPPSTPTIRNGSIVNGGVRP